MRHQTSSTGLLGLCLAAACLLAIGWTLHSGSARANSLYIGGGYTVPAQSAVSD